LSFSSPCDTLTFDSF
jgi:hypothetical protein